MIKVIMVGPVPKPYTGQSITFKKLRDELSLEQDVKVFHVDTSPKSKGNHVTGKFSLMRLFETLKVIFLFIYFIVNNKIDSVYLTKGSTVLGFIRDLGLIVLKCVISPRTRFIVHLKGGNYDVFYHSSSFFLKTLIRFFLRKIDIIIVLGDSLVSMYNFMPQIRAKIVVIENALTFSPIYKYNHQKVSKEITFTFLSNLIFTKGYTYFAQAGQLLNSKGVVGFKLVFAGQFMFSPDDPDDIESQQARFLDIVNSNSNIEYLGSVNGDEKDRVLFNSDVLVLPSNYHVEGQPNCIIEAMAYSNAIISTNYRSIPDLIDDENSLFVIYSDVNDLATKMEFLIKSQKLSIMQRKSYELYNQKFTWETHYEKIKKVILGQHYNE
ncbi:glycosyltransferase family 4 protein [Vibrio cholerae]|uniref:glycosyltransferase family 4 protein n=1 Tax=Vibrio metoecus TaxID=1481663 RepID=UPI0012AE9252|nr:glycosyltransferase family 4 protein [Vibrio metoecus]